jgi:hypothetical protein
MSLTLSGDSPKISADGTGVITSGTAVTASGTQVNFTGIPSWVKRITVMFNGVSTNGVSLVQVQLGDSGGIENTGYVGNDTRSATASITSSYSTGFVLCPDGNATYALTGKISIELQTGNTWVESHTLSVGSANGVAFGGGSKTLSDVLTQIRITTVNGTDTFDAGSINILYE